MKILQKGNINRLNKLMWDNDGAGVFKKEVVREGSNHIHLADWIIVSEDDVEDSGFDKICAVK